MAEDLPHYKLIFLGDQYVGKSSILNRFYQDKFEPDYQATIGLDFHSKNTEINGESVRLLLYDTAGQEKFKSLIPMYIRDANIILVVYDITLKDSFVHTEHWVNETKDLKREDAIFVLIGNKIDLEDKRAVTTKEAEDYATGKGFIFHEVSAKTGERVEELFSQKIFPEMARKFRIGHDGEEGVEGGEGGNEQDNGIKLEEQQLNIIDEKEYKLNTIEDSFQIKIAKNGSKNKIIIKISKINKLTDFYYENIFNFDELLNLDKMFRAYDELEEIFGVLISFFEEKKVKIKEVKEDTITLCLKILSMTGKEKIIEIKLYKKEMMKDCIIKELCKKVNKLEEENKILKNEIKIIRNDLDELKIWKNENEEEMKKLIKEKKNKISLENIDSKILTKKEQFEFIENAYKNNEKILMNKIFKPKLLYRATKDGDLASTFHKKCDNIKGTLTLVKTKKGFIFGGCTEESWDGSCYKKDDKSFCFSLDLNKIYKNKKTNYGIRCLSDHGPIFGNYIFAIYNNCFSKGGLMNDGLNVNYDNQEKENEINNGDQKFGVVEVEVFEIILE